MTSQLLALPQVNNAAMDGLAVPSRGLKILSGTGNRALAEEIARKHAVDAGDVEHVLSNLTLPPIERLRRSMRRARLGRPAGK